jgi:hypothetical protein
MVTVAFCLNVVVVSVMQLALARTPTEVAGVVTVTVSVTVVLPPAAVPATLNVAEGGVPTTPVVTLQMTITPFTGVIVTAFGLIAAFRALPFLTCFVV